VTCFRADFGVGAPEAPEVVSLQQAGGAPLATAGVAREVPLHTGRVILPSRGVVADVTCNLLAAHAYVGPGKKHAGWLHGNQSLLIPREEFPAEVAAIDEIVAKVAEAGRAVPLCWRQQTLALGAPAGKPEDAHRLGGPASVSAVGPAGAPAAEKTPGGSPAAPLPAPRVQVPKAQGGSAWDQAKAPTPAQDRPGFPPLGPAGAETQTVKAPTPASGGGGGGGGARAPAADGGGGGGGRGARTPAAGGRGGGGGVKRQPEFFRAGPEAAARAMVAAVLKAGCVADLKLWGHDGVAHAALVLGVGPLEKGVPGQGRVPVCRQLLVEARKRAGGPRAGFGLFLGHS
jgi:hypothetical protein